jgi:cephalosporin hydroxylase
MNLDEVNRLVKQSQRPLADGWLEGCQQNFIGEERRNYYRFLYLMILALKPSLSLEIGVAYGLGAVHMAGAAATYGGQVIGIDLRWHDFPGNEVGEHYGNYHYLSGDSTTPTVIEQVKRLTRRFGKLGFVFQDSSHRYHPSQAEWNAYTALLAPGAVWVCDDITVRMEDDDTTPKGLKEYWAEISTGRTAATYNEILHHGNAMGVILF